MLILCFLGVVLTTVGTIYLDGTLQHVCQTGFLVVAVLSVLLGLSGKFN